MKTAFTYKPDFADVLNRFEAWWACELVDRPPVSIHIGREPKDRLPVPESRHATLRERWLDTGFRVASARAAMHNTIFYGDALPVVIPNLGPEVFSAFYGCELEFGESTSWSEPILEDWSPESLAALQLDEDNVYYRRVLEMTEALVAEAGDDFIVGYTDLHGGGDAIAAFRDPQNLLIDTLEHPEAIKALGERITTDFLRVFDLYHERLSAAGMPSTTWCHVTGLGKMHVPSNDFSCMISEDSFKDLFIPGIIRECRHMDRCIYHLDGPQALRYLDRLLDIPEIHAIQWVPGAGREYWGDWIEVYQRIQSRGKAIQLPQVPVGDLPHVFEVLRPEGVWISSLSGIRNQEEADAALQAVTRWKS